MKPSLCAIGVVLFVAVAVLPTQLSSFEQTQQQPEIRVPTDLPSPVGEEMRVDAQDLDAALADADVVLLDVREPWELEKFGTRKGYIHIPLVELENRLDELPNDKTILTA